MRVKSHLQQAHAHIAHQHSFSPPSLLVFDFALPLHMPQLIAAAGRVVGAYPETKHPTWHNALPFMQGSDMNDIVLDVLTKNGYKGNMASKTWQEKPVFIQVGAKLGIGM